MQGQGRDQASICVRVWSIENASFLFFLRLLLLLLSPLLILNVLVGCESIVHESSGTFPNAISSLVLHLFTYITFQYLFRIISWTGNWVFLCEKIKTRHSMNQFIIV